MKKLIALLFLTCGVLSVNSQSNTPPSTMEKNEVNKLLTHYTQYKNSMPAEEKAKFIRYYIYSPQIYVYNDLDTLSKPEDVLTFQEYDKIKMATKVGSFVNGSLILGSAKLGNVKCDAERKYYYIDVEVEKEYFGRKFTETKTPEGGSIITSAPIDFPSKTLHFVIAFEKAGTLSKNFKIAAISLKGTEPKLPEIKK